MLSLRIIALLFGIVALGLSVAVAVRYVHFFALVAILILSIMWNLANITTRMCRARPIHPGANVACDLLLWLFLVIVVIFMYLLAIFDLLDDEYDYAYSGDCYYSSYGYTSNCSYDYTGDSHRFALALAASSVAAVAL